MILSISLAVITYYSKEEFLPTIFPTTCVSSGHSLQKFDLHTLSENQKVGEINKACLISGLYGIEKLHLILHHISIHYLGF